MYEYTEEDEKKLSDDKVLREVFIVTRTKQDSDLDIMLNRRVEYYR